ncbi:hypothetical protein V6N13_121970 [Hibiscus sabdariffa]
MWALPAQVGADKLKKQDALDDEPGEFEALLPHRSYGAIFNDGRTILSDLIQNEFLLFKLSFSMAGTSYFTALVRFAGFGWPLDDSKFKEQVPKVIFVSLLQYTLLEQLQDTNVDK